MKTRKRLFALVLTLSMLISLAATAFAKQAVEVLTVFDDETGVTYTLHISESPGEQEIIVTSDANKDKLKIEYIEGERLTTTQYTLERSYLFGLKNSYSKEEVSFDLSDTDVLQGQIAGTGDRFIGEMFAQAISYNTTYKDAWARKYSYAKGSEGSTAYLKIGDGATSYRITLTGLSSSKRTQCDDYIKAIDASNKADVNASIGEVGIAGTAFGAMIAVALASVFSRALAIVLATALLGITGFTAKQIVDMYFAYRDAKNLYAEIKTYGTKL